jgi:putative tributyrin esterase
MARLSLALSISLAFAFTASLGCRSKQAAPADHPRLTPGVKMVDVSFHSVALNRYIPYRVVLPAEIVPARKLPALYLLHGGGGGFRDWTNYSDVARFAEYGIVLVMPEGDESYYVNSADHPQDRYEDYIVHDLIADAESRFSIASDRTQRAIAGVSMGGFGAILLTLKHPELFIYARGLSPALDVPSRPFSIKRVEQWRHHSSIFGAWGSEHRKENDPFVIARTIDPSKVPYISFSCGEQEGLLPANKKFAALLQQRHIRYEFRTVPGGHDWNQWDRNLADLMKPFFARLPVQM